VAQSPVARSDNDTPPDCDALDANVVARARAVCIPYGPQSIVNLQDIGRLAENLRGKSHDPFEFQNPLRDTKRIPMKKIEKVATSLLFALVASGGSSKIH
jgi:hypothetical protein